MPAPKPEPVAPVFVSASTSTQNDEKEEQREEDRRAKLKSMSHKPNVVSNIEEMEKIPAYQRRNVLLPDVSQVNENPPSQYTLGLDNNNASVLKENKFWNNKPDWKAQKTNGIH